LSERAYFDLARLHLLHATCWVDSTLGSPTNLMQPLEWCDLFSHDYWPVVY